MHNLIKNFIKYVSLNIIGMIGLSCYILADTFFIAKSLGTAGLAALNFSISIFSILQGLGLMIGIGGATRFSILKNNGKSEKSNSIFVHSLLIGALVSLFFVTIAIFFTKPLSVGLGADEVTLPLTKIYLTIILSFSPFFVLNNILLAFIRNDNNPKLSMTAMLINSFSNIILDYIFMFPLSMGIFGAAFATGLSPVISLGVLSLHFMNKKKGFHICKCKVRISIIIDIVLLGFSSFIGELASAISLITFNLVILRIEGNTGVAAYGIIANIALIAVAVFTGVAQGIQPLASEYYGKNDTKSLRSILQYGIITAFSLSLFIYLTVFCFSSTIVAAFNSECDNILAYIANKGLKVYFLGYFFAGINIVSTAFLSATSNSKQAMLISIMRSSILLVPSVLILSMTFKMNGVWLSFVSTEFLVFLISCFSLHSFKKDSKL
ncbi:MATE family efflux transporter [Anaerovorax sp. IOR16]|uniref:MATE family efflux transporter n=1 Tax=Anaerovorax sp. IOR16 TaxID=2773458 RepID=UPI0019D069F8|nr:MATE family efflux transporter [Anaerovorax sp. IOR16]